MYKPIVQSVVISTETWRYEADTDNVSKRMHCEYPTVCQEWAKLLTNETMRTKRQ